MRATQMGSLPSPRLRGAMKKIVSTLVLASTLTLLLTIVSLGGPQGDRSTGVEDQSSSWSTRIEGKQVPGIANGCIRIVKLMPGTPPGVTLAFWSDTGNGISGRAEGQSGRATLSGTIVGRDGASFKVDAITSDGSTATVTIAGKEYESVKDAMFLIRTDGKKARVKKLKYDPQTFPKISDVNALVKHAQSTEALNDFWSSEDPTSDESKSGGDSKSNADATSPGQSRNNAENEVSAPSSESGANEPRL